MPVQLDTTPYWIESATFPKHPPLDRDLRVDVVVVGGGIAGLTTAYLLASAGRSVAVLERSRLATIDTGHTSAHLTMVTDVRLTDLVKNFGRDHAQAVWDAGLAAIAQIDTIVREEQIACDFAWVRGYLHAPAGEVSAGDISALEEEAALAVELGFDASFVPEVPLVGTPGVLFDDQARFHPRRYLSALATAITSRGGHIFEHSAAAEFSDKPRAVKAKNHTITCDRIVVATHTPLAGNNNIVSATFFQTKQALYTTYVVAGVMPRNTVPDALMWDTGDPYHYLRIEREPDHDFVIYGGEDHKTGQETNTQQCYERLQSALRAIAPDIEITHRWSGQVVETPDGLPYIGETTDGQFASTGFSGNGMTFGTLAGMMAADWVEGGKNPWSELLSPGRTKIVGAAWDYLKENKDYPYYLVRDRFAGAATKSLRCVKRGEGKIVELNGETLAAYRDEAGAMELHSATCTHMGCLVEWNKAERTWDCPCHGSRFGHDGKVIAGPAETPLADPSSR